MSGAPLPPAPGSAPDSSPRSARWAVWADLDPAIANAVLRLRVDVFVVEQACAYPELDGRDLEPDAEHHWVPGHREPVGAYLRVLSEPGGERRVGRVVTSATARRKGLAGELVASVIAAHGHRPLVLSAQSHLEGWYTRHGFAASGPGFDEDGIPHVPMRREPV